MIKHDTIHNPKSCFNTANDQEHLFVLLARDPAAPVAIRAWITERLRLGRNKPGDEQIREAYECAALMELQRNDVPTLMGPQRPEKQLPSAEIQGPLRFSISRFTSIHDRRPCREMLSWQDLVALFSQPLRTACTRRTCLRGTCPHKLGPCWSPAIFAKQELPSLRTTGALPLLVFDVDQLAADRLEEIRCRLDSLQYLVHSTHSDRFDSRCLRIVIALSHPVPADMWGPFFHASMQSLVPWADPRCADADRRYFLPSCPRDEGYATEVHAGAPLDVDVLLGTIPPVMVAPSFLSEVESQVAP